MRRRVPLWSVGCLVITAWGVGRLLGAATGSLAAVAIGSATVSLGGYALIAWYLRSLPPLPQVPVRHGGEAENPLVLAGRAIASYVLTRIPGLGWIITALLIATIGQELDPWPGQPHLDGGITAHHVLAVCATLALLLAIDLRIVLFSRRRGIDEDSW